METEKLRSRNSTLDIIRIVAAFTVCSVHFFLHNGFYSEPLTGYGPVEGIIKYISSGNTSDLHGPIMFVMVLMRTLFGVCVPLFLILTGWLMSKKEISKAYYKGIRKTLIIFVLASIACMAFKSVFNVPEAKAAFNSLDFGSMIDAIKASGDYTLKKYILSIFDFTGANYSWYIEMYIGLFLIAPFLNLAYNKLGSKKRKQALVLTFFCITILPSIVNVYNFDTRTWWLDPAENSTYQKLIPSFWMGFYPVAYYFVGAYLREYGIKLRTRSVAAAFAVSLALFTAFNWFRSEGGGFKSKLYVYWYGVEPYVLTVLLFVMLSRINTEKIKETTANALKFLADLALGAYLMSYVSDELIYEQLRLRVPVMTDRLPYYFICVPLSFIFAMMMSFILNTLESSISSAIEKTKGLVRAIKNSSDKRVYCDILFGTLLLMGMTFAFWKCRYGFGGSDEGFYLTIPHRLVLGDSMFTDEWHLSQLSAFLLLPFTYLFTAITGSTTGIIIAARVFYVIVHALASLLIYTRIRKYGLLAAVGSALYFIYTPYNIMALNYDSMGLGLVTLTGIMLATADYDKKLWIILSGLAFAGAVLCNPYLLIGYALYILLMIAHLALSKRETSPVIKSKIFAPRTFLFFTLGAGILAALFMIFTLTRVSFAEIFKNLPYMLNDPEHPSIPFADNLNYYFNAIFNCHAMFKYAVYAYAVMLAVMIFDRKRKRHRSLYLIASAVLTGYTLMLFFDGIHWSTYNYIMFPFIFITVTSYILCDNKPRELFVTLFCLGALYSLCIHFSSNQYFYVISMAVTACNLAGYVFLAQVLWEMRRDPDELTYEWWLTRIAFLAIACTVVLQGSMQVTSKAENTFWDYNPSTLDAQIEDGPAKGVITNTYNKDEYTRLYNDIVSYRDMPDENILFITEKSWMYLAVHDKPYATYSGWLSDMYPDNSLNRLKTYYELNPDKIPYYIYMPKSANFDFERVITEAKANGYFLTETDAGYKLEKP